MLFENAQLQPRISGKYWKSSFILFCCSCCLDGDECAWKRMKKWMYGWIDKRKLRYKHMEICRFSLCLVAIVVVARPAASIERSLARLRSVAANPTGRSGNGCVALYWQYPEEAGMQASLASLFFVFFLFSFSPFVFVAPTITADDVIWIHPGNGAQAKK